MLSNSLVSPLNSLLDVWTRWRKRRAALVQLGASDPTELRHMAEDVGVSVAELRTLAVQDEHAADLLQCRLRTLRIDPNTIELGVLRDLQRCCSQCKDKALCAHELEDRPKDATWPAYCPNEDTINALIAERKMPRGGKREGVS